MKRSKKNMKGKDTFSLRLDFKFKEQLAIEAQNLGISLNAYIIILIHKGRQD